MAIFSLMNPGNDPGDTPVIPVKIRKSMKSVGRVSEYCIKLSIAILQGVYLILLDISSLIQTKLSAVLRSSLFLWFPRGMCIMFYQLELFTGL